MSLREIALECCEILHFCGVNKPTSTISKDDKSTILNMLGAHAVIFSAKAELDQFSEGLKTHGVLQVLSLYQSVLEPFFTHGHQEPLTAGKLPYCMYVQNPIQFTLHFTESIKRGFNTVMYSEKGSNERSREEATYLLFNEYLEEIEAGTMYKT